MSVGAKLGAKIFSSIDWSAVSDHMHEKGYALVPAVLSREICDKFIANYHGSHYRKTVVMERHRFGLGEYRYFDYPLPPIVQTVREQIYPHLAEIANNWAIGMISPIKPLLLRPKPDRTKPGCNTFAVTFVPAKCLDNS